MAAVFRAMVEEEEEAVGGGKEAAAEGERVLVGPAMAAAAARVLAAAREVVVREVAEMGMRQTIGGAPNTAASHAARGCHPAGSKAAVRR